MGVTVRKYTEDDLAEMNALWNAVVEEGDAFPQDMPMSMEEGLRFFAEQSYAAVAEADGKIAGLYVLHPNNVGRCGHIANASYAVKAGTRGQGVGELLVRDSIRAAASLSFKILQYNAVVATNAAAIRLYERLGFRRLGTIPGGFRMKDGSYEDIVPFYISL